MFHVPLSHVTFEQVERFCREFPEGVRVEYKQEPTDKIPKVISSFANTMGGIWVIGVRTDRANRARLPITGMAGRGGIEEQIVQSAQTSIYPAITPDVRVLNVPNEADRIVAIVKVHESVEAPHAVDNSTRVYVRVASTTQPCEIADIDRIEYLLKRRQEPERRREELIAKAAARSPHQATLCRIRVIVAPVYPRGQIVPLDLLHERASVLEQQAPYFLLRRFRRVHEGISASSRISPDIEHHLEIDGHGIAYYESPFELDGEQTALGTGEIIPYVRPGTLVKHAAYVLNHVLGLLHGTMANVLIRYELFGMTRVGFVPDFGDRQIDQANLVRQHRCIDYHIAVSVQTILETLAERRIAVLTEILEQVLWAFDYEDTDLQNRIGRLLRASHLA